MINKDKSYFDSLLKDKILLITGWGVGIESLHSLKLGLTKAGYDTQLINIFNVFLTAFLGFPFILMFCLFSLFILSRSFLKDRNS